MSFDIGKSITLASILQILFELCPHNAQVMRAGRAVCGHPGRIPRAYGEGIRAGLWAVSDRAGMPPERGAENHVRRAGVTETRVNAL